MNRYFDIKELEEDLDNNKCFSDSFENEMTYKVASLKQLYGHLPSLGQILFIETLKSFTAFTFIVYVLRSTEYINHLYIATYSTNDRIINALLRYKNTGKIGSIHIHISETIKFRMPAIYQKLINLNKEGVIQLSFAWSHKKVTCMDTTAGYFIVEGSGNYGENAMEEQYIFLQSKKVYDFRSGNK